MDADLDLLLTVVYCAVDDLLPQRPENARRRITDAEVITLCIAQAVLDCRSDEQFTWSSRGTVCATCSPRCPTAAPFTSAGCACRTSSRD